MEKFDLFLYFTSSASQKQMQILHEFACAAVITVLINLPLCIPLHIPSLPLSCMSNELHQHSRNTPESACHTFLFIKFSLFLWWKMKWCVNNRKVLPPLNDQQEDYNGWGIRWTFQVWRRPSPMTREEIDWIDICGGPYWLSPLSLVLIGCIIVAPKDRIERDCGKKDCHCHISPLKNNYYFYENCAVRGNKWRD